MPKSKIQGFCKLTGDYGNFVASHIIPKALTKPSAPGRPFIQAGGGIRPTRRFDSWYDENLVTRRGEDVLSSLDSAGIELLKKHQLIWRGREAGDELEGEILWPEEGGAGLRIIPAVNTQKLRLFLLSILWRAAQSGRTEFSEVELPADHLQRLKDIILEIEAVPSNWYQTILTQVVDVGPNHNMTPQALETPIQDAQGNDIGYMRSLRFYFDGLIVSYVRPSSDGLTEHEIKYTQNNETRNYPVVLVKNEDSRQLKQLKASIAEAEMQWPDLIEKLSEEKNEDLMPGHPDIANGDGLVMMHDLVISLDEDVSQAYELLETCRSSQFYRRVTARAIFAYIEAIIEAIRNELRSNTRTGVIKFELTTNDKETLGFLSHTGVPSKFLPLDESLKRTFKLAAKLWELDFKLDTGGNNFAEFLAAKSSRNKLTHPRTVYDIEVTDEDMHLYTVAGIWVQTEVKRLFKARQESLIAMMSPEYRATFHSMLRDNDPLNETNT
ncbi:hypothetical protein [Xanthomonas campestris]|uniref:hypothetical protein n=1 Tax=Xanthomonas campestris TaxID=339 RepID=UPI001CD20EC9|nr:hypothetical protein [Xanthomonas campestris]